ncbi:hypothetical protein [Sorangium sp. So ce124]|uniref:RCC1 domain-containing protein n=1 Tax=Sorangium sp. So ce124 TaxID=3133280 RepID=UPI003F5FDC3C
MAGATVALVAAASCNQVASIRGGLPGDERCFMVAEGTPLPEQTAGDCAQFVCDGAGSVKQVPLLADVPDDGRSCTIDGCDGMTPVHILADSAPCYTGPPGTEGVGICSAGLQRCEEGKPVGSCDGEVTPQLEVCDARSDDEDCDGETNEEGDNCACGDGWVSVGEECDDGGPVEGDGCTPSCVQERVVKIAAGYYHTCAVLNTGRIKCWGANDSKQLGLGDIVARGVEAGQMGSALPVANLGVDAKVESLAMGAKHTCARLTSREVKCWGQPGLLGFSSPVDWRANEMGDRLVAVDLDGVVIAVAAGGAHTCALVSGDVTRCWGGNAERQLGFDDTESRVVTPRAPVNLGDGMVALSLALGEAHSCARLKDDIVKCWGSNRFGQLGFGGVWDNDYEMGDRLPIVDLGGEPTLMLSAGHDHTCALLTGGRVRCWGHNDNGQLGRGDTSDRYGASSPTDDVDVGETVTGLVAGEAHTCALLAGGRVKCWGLNDSGQLGLGDTVNRGDAPDGMGDTLPPVDLGEGATAEAITAGANHTCALLTDGRVKCWGSNGSGQLGLGDRENRGDKSGTMGDALAAVELFKSP